MDLPRRGNRGVELLSRGDRAMVLKIPKFYDAKDAISFILGEQLLYPNNQICSPKMSCP